MSEKRFLRKPGEDNYSHRKGEEIMTFFGITHEGLDQSDSHLLLSREMLIRQFCVCKISSQSHYPWKEFECIQPDTLANFRVYALFEYTKNIPSSSLSTVKNCRLPVSAVVDHTYIFLCYFGKVIRNSKADCSFFQL
jgi:hypothetical protein